MAHPISDFIECDGCGFVLHAKSSTDPEPRHWSECPSCEGTEFTYSS